MNSALGDVSALIVVTCRDLQPRQLATLNRRSNFNLGLTRLLNGSRLFVVYLFSNTFRYIQCTCTLVQYTIYMYIVHVHVSFIILTISQKCIHEFSRLGIQVSCTFYFSFMINFCYSRLPGCRCTCLYIHVSR